jgi:hypothetical protein
LRAARAYRQLKAAAPAAILLVAAGCYHATPATPATAVLAPPPAPIAPECQPLATRIRATYTFKPSRLTAAQQDQKSAALDQFWKQVQGDPLRLAPCLRAALNDPTADPFFLFDGSALLVAVDPGIESKALQVRLWSAAPLEDIDLRLWIETLAARAYEGFDVSAAGARWLSDLSHHYAAPGPTGDASIDAQLGALFLFGSQDESRSTPALARIAADGKHPGRLIAIWLLVFQLTPEAAQALRAVDVSAMPSEAQAAIGAVLSPPPLPATHPPAVPARIREHWLQAFGALLNGDPTTLNDLKQPDAGAHWADSLPTILKPEDVSLLRLVRRFTAKAATPAAGDEYIALSGAIGALGRQR